MRHLPERVPTEIAVGRQRVVRDRFTRRRLRAASYFIVTTSPHNTSTRIAAVQRSVFRQFDWPPLECAPLVHWPSLGRGASASLEVLKAFVCCLLF